LKQGKNKADFTSTSQRR